MSSLLRLHLFERQKLNQPSDILAISSDKKGVSLRCFTYVVPSAASGDQKVRTSDPVALVRRNLSTLDKNITALPSSIEYTDISSHPLKSWSRPILSFKKTTRSFCLNQRLTRGHSLHSSGWNCRDGPSRGHHRVPVISLEVGDKLGDSIFYIYVDASYVVFLQKTLQTGKKTRWIFQTWGQFLPYGIFLFLFLRVSKRFFWNSRIENWEHMFFFSGEKEFNWRDTQK